MMQPTLNLINSFMVQQFYPTDIMPEISYTGAGEPVCRIIGSWLQNSGSDAWILLYDSEHIEFVFDDIKISNEYISLPVFIDSIWPYVRYYWEIKSLESLD